MDPRRLSVQGNQDLRGDHCSEGLKGTKSSREKAGKKAKASEVEMEEHILDGGGTGMIYILRFNAV